MLLPAFSKSKLKANSIRCVSNLRKPTTTPVFGDGNWPDCWPDHNSAMVDGAATPQDGMQCDLHNGDQHIYPDGATGGCPIGRFLIARHGSRAAASARAIAEPFETSLPGMINLSFSDGHAEAVHLYNLWTFTWSAQSVPHGQPAN